MSEKNDKLIAAIRQCEEQAESSNLQGDREKALAYYNGDPFGNEVDGRSQVVSRDVHDTVEWIKPSLLKMFASGDEVVKFNPVGAEDVEASEQESEYVNHIFMQKNNGFMILHDWFHEALLLKNSYARAYWDDSEIIETERYAGLDDSLLAVVMQDPDVEVTAAELDEYGAYTIEVKRKQNYGCVKIEVLPVEQCRTSHSCRTVSVINADFFQFWDYKTITDLRLDGYKVDDDINDGESSDYEEWLRNEQADTINYGKEETYDPSMRKVKVRETWIRFDANEDGKAELLHIICVGDEILLKEEADIIPIAAISPSPNPHRHNGNSIADSVMDLQLIKSTLMRGYLDNTYLANNGRYAISDRVNLNDMLSSRPGGIVRVQGEPGGAIMPLVHPQIGAAILQGIEYIDAIKENRTGVTRYNQGIDANSLNKTASGITQIMSASQQRIELIARIFAEGVKELFWIIHKLTKQNATKEEVIRLRNDWVPVDPRTWKTRNDLTISVGLGTGNKDQMLMHLQTILMAQKEALGIGVATPQNVYEALKALTMNAGFKDVEKFWTDPSKQEPRAPQPSPEEQKMQIEMRMEQQRMQNDQQKSQAEFALKQEEMQANMSLEKWKVENELMLKKYEAELKAETEVQKNSAQVEAMSRPAVQLNGDNILSQVAESLDGRMNEHNQSIQSAQQDLAQAIGEINSAVTSLAQIAEKASRPKKVKYGADGRVEGVE